MMLHHLIIKDLTIHGKWYLKNGFAISDAFVQTSYQNYMCVHIIFDTGK